MNQKSALEAGEILAVDDVAFFDGGKAPWTTRAVTKDGRYALCTAKVDGRVVYTIVDWQQGIRGAMNVIGGGLGIETVNGPDENIDDAVRMLEEDGFEVSHRNNVPLLISAVIKFESGAA